MVHVYYLIVCRTDDPHQTLREGFKVGRCRTCDREVNVSKEGQDKLATGQYEIKCVQCYAQMRDSGQPTILIAPNNPRPDPETN